MEQQTAQSQNQDSRWRFGIAFCTCGDWSKGVDSDDSEPNPTLPPKAEGPGSSLGRSDRRKLVFLWCHARHNLNFYPNVSSGPSKSILSSSHTVDEEEPTPRAIGIRRARGGRWFVDKRLPSSRPLAIPDTSNLFTFCRRTHNGDSDDERQRKMRNALHRLAERWKFDEDDYPVVGPEGPEEQDRVLMDDYEPRFLRLLYCTNKTNILL